MSHVTGMCQRRGVALLVVLWAIAVLATVTAVASSAARSSASIAKNRRAIAIARAMAESGIVAATVMVNDSLRTFSGDTLARDAFLSRLEPRSDNANALVDETLDDGSFAVTVVDVSARLDVNNAGMEGLLRLFRTVTSDDEARAAALAIDARVRGEDLAGDSLSNVRMQRDSLSAELLGRAVTVGIRRPFESLDELLLVPSVSRQLLNRVASSLTVDGDGRVNRRAASAQVLASASGSLVERPSRLLFIARGWERGHSVTREIQAVYDLADDGLRLVRWREQDR